jgi:23S rRNA (uracil1939-C5)-methyltransferase
VVQTLLDQPPARLVYVSCDPATLARDVAALQAGYDVRSVACFDLFPQTAHVETVLALRRRGGEI